MTETPTGSSIETSPTETRSVIELVNDATEQMAHLIRDEIKLAELEVQSKGRRLGRGAVVTGAGALTACYGAAAVIAAAIIALAGPLSGWAAALIVGVVLLLVGGVLALIGKKDLQKAVPPVPEEAITGVRRDIHAIKIGG
ncbi:phage holin family protein [Nocardia anaemiae]|uniref:phage holin family protein n=1 Tax=Nocardia anaemiae TaxID=263910 RepID=UPI0007A391F4|nr:phage holin family protein [Nocardia anaemiae]